MCITSMKVTLYFRDKENGYKGFTVFEHLKFLSSFINFATIQSLCSHTVFDFDFQQCTNKSMHEYSILKIMYRYSILKIMYICTYTTF